MASPTPLAVRSPADPAKGCAESPRPWLGTGVKESPDQTGGQKLWSEALPGCGAEIPNREGGSDTHDGASQPGTDVWLLARPRELWRGGTLRGQANAGGARGDRKVALSSRHRGVGRRETAHPVEPPGPRPWGRGVDPDRTLIFQVSAIPGPMLAWSQLSYGVPRIPRVSGMSPVAEVPWRTGSSSSAQRRTEPGSPSPRGSWPRRRAAVAGGKDRQPQAARATFLQGSAVP